ncbi:vhs domain containing protein [Sporothrix brasiliensis 5110]|uniref:Vhs domain containing protein n=1 Tax=Sporothrix brasiliensis 5110 TaxID=1398154 RepID=A0A0C2IMI0_9PEZI|nr:vhs domain containing protein [Sporothrix brasiliensis 5110]KIH88230.1 vhs domain containing protein [Sporothrix brasiliensis 5110]
MFSQKKPYSAVTVTIENLTGEAYEEDDLSGIPDLVEVIKLQASGPTEAARAIRKKLKYGSVHRQLRALTLLDGLIQNAGPRFQRSFVDEMLLERLRVCGTSDMSDPDVRKKCSVLFRGWAAEYKNTPGMERLARLYKELPQRKQVVTQAQSRVVRETENPFDDDEDEADTAANAAAAAAAASFSSSSRTFAPQTQTQPTGRIESFSSLGRDGSSSSSSKPSKAKDKRSSTSGNKKSRKPFNLEAEKPVMKATIADASIASTDLTNTLQTINRELERISENEAAIARFEKCKLLRRKILRYIYLVNSEEYLGSLLHANDELVTALMLFEQLDRSIDADSDSDDDLAEQAHRYRMIQEQAAKDKESGSTPASPTSASAVVPDFATLNLGDATSGRSSKRNSGVPSPPVPVPPPQQAPLPALPQQAPRPPAPPRPSAMSKPAVGHLGGRPAVPTAAMMAADAARNRSAGGGGDDSDGDSYVDDDDNDPFADRNAVGTPKVEQGEPRW